MESKKRKREDEVDSAANAVLTFHAPNGRTFSRLFKEKSLDTTKETVRKKLDLAANAKFSLAQLRDNKVVDLEDDDDFAALRALARTTASLDVQVIVHEDPLDRSETQPATNTSDLPTSLAQPQASSSRRPQLQDVAVSTPSRAPLNVSAFSPPAASTPLTTHAGDTVVKRKKKRKVKKDVPAGDTPLPNVEPPAPPESPPRKKRKSKAGRLDALPLDSSLAAPIEAPADSAARAEATGKLPVVSEQAKASSEVEPLDITETEVVKTKKKKRKTSEAAPQVGSSADTAQAMPTTKKVKKRKISVAEDTEPVAHLSKQTVSDVVPPQVSHKPTLQQAIVASTTSESAEAPPRKKKKVSFDQQVSPRASSKGKQRAVEVVESRSPIRELAPIAETPATPDEGGKKKKKLRAKKLSVDSQVSAPNVGAPAEDGEEDQPAQMLKKKKSRQLVATEVEPPAVQVFCTLRPAKWPSDDVDHEEQGVDLVEKQVQKAKRRIGQLLTEQGQGVQPSRDLPQPASTDPIVSPEEVSVATVAKRSKGTKKAGAAEQPQAEPQTPTSAHIASAKHIDQPPPQGPTNARAKKAKKAAVEVSPENESVVRSAIENILGRVASASTAPVAPQAASPTVLPEVEKVVAGVAKPNVPAPSSAQLSTYPRPPRQDGKETDPETGDSGPAVPRDIQLSQTRKVPSRSKRARVTASPRCALCLAPFHYRYNCPIVRAGAKSIQQKIDELRQDGGNNELIHDLETDLQLARRKAARNSSPARSEGGGSDPAPDADDIPSPRAVSPEIPILSGPPAGSTISEVLVEAEDDGSSSESSSESDGETEDEREDEETNAPSSSFKSGLAIAPVLDEVDFESLLRGPTGSKSVLDLIPSESDSEQDEESVDEKLASEEEEREERIFKRVSKRFERDAPSSDEDEEEDPSPEPPSLNGKDSLDASVVSETPAAAKSASRDGTKSASPGSEHLIAASVSHKSPLDEETVPTSDPAEAAHGAADSQRSSTSVDDSVPKSSSHLAGPPAVTPASKVRGAAADGNGVENREHRQSSEVTVVPAQPSASLSSKPQDAASVHDDDSDDIESADEPVMDEDPIEPSLTQHVRDATPPPRTMQLPGTSKKMKDRNGKIRREDELPMLASVVLRARARSTSEQSSSLNETPGNPQALASSASKPESALKSGADFKAPSAPAAEPTSATAPKRRGRPPLPPEERARRAAEKERIQAARKEEREMKARQKAEKTTKGRKSLPVNVSSSTWTASGIEKTVPLDVPNTPASAPAQKRRESSSPVVKWATLNQTPVSGEADASMVDELRSSSAPPEVAAAADGPGDTQPATSQHALIKSRGIILGTQSNLVTPMNKANGAASTTPLFLVTDTQLRSSQSNTRLGANHEQSPTRNGAVDSSQADLTAKKLMRPASAWESRFPRLTHIHSQGMFSPLSAHAIPTPSLSKTAKESQRQNTFSKLSSADSSESEDESGEEDSHIPKNRLAGMQK